MNKALWNIIAALAGLLAVAVAVFVFSREQAAQRKSLEVELVSRLALVDERLAESQKRIEVLYDGRKIPNFAVLQFRVANVGGQPIRTADFETPIEVKFGGVGEILSAEQRSSSPGDLKVSPIVKGEAIEIPGVLLNPGDWFALDVGIASRLGPAPIATPSGRIAGVREIEFRDSTAAAAEPRAVPRWMLVLQLVVVVLTLPMMLYQVWMLFQRRLRGG